MHLLIALYILTHAAFASATEDSVTPAALAAGQASIEKFHSALLETMMLDEHPAREARLNGIIKEIFDVRRIASISLGRTWRELDKSQRTDFISRLSELIVATYADRFDSFNGQRFTTLGVQQARGGFVVRTELIKNDGGKVSLDYFLRDGRVFNVVADGVSDLSLRRADYNSILKSEGYAALLGHIQEKVALARAGS